MESDGFVALNKGRLPRPLYNFVFVLVRVAVVRSGEVRMKKKRVRSDEPQNVRQKPHLETNTFET